MFNVQIGVVPPLTSPQPCRGWVLLPLPAPWYIIKSQEMGPGLRNVQLSKTNSADNPQYLQMTQLKTSLPSNGAVPCWNKPPKHLQ